MILDVAPINPITNNSSTAIIIGIAIVIVLTVAIVCTLLLKKKNAK